MAGGQGQRQGPGSRCRGQGSLPGTTGTALHQLRARERRCLSLPFSTCRSLHNTDPVELINNVTNLTAYFISAKYYILSHFILMPPKMPLACAQVSNDNSHGTYCIPLFTNLW